MHRSKKFRIKFMFQQFDLPCGEVVIGRSVTCTITLEDPLVSRRHARLTVTDDAVSIEDMGSRNGTFVNDVRVVSPRALHHKDRIQIGGQSLLFLEEETTEGSGRSTGALIRCPGCGATVADAGPACPHCGASLHQDPRVSVSHLVSPTVPPPDTGEDTTNPAIAAGAVNWTHDLLFEVLDRALATDDDARSVRVLRQCMAYCGADAPERLLHQVTQYAVAVSQRTKDPSFVLWAIHRWRDTRRTMPEALFVHMTAMAPIPELRSVRDALAAYLREADRWERDPRAVAALRKYLDAAPPGA